MYEISEYMLDYIFERKLTKDYLEKINIPKEVLDNKPIKDKSNFKLTINLKDYLEEMVDQINVFLWEELHYKDEWKNIEEIKLVTIMKKFDFPICLFWLTFCEIVKTSFDTSVYTLKF